MMRLAKSTGKNLRSLAAEVAEAVGSTLFEDVSVAGPGFVNFWIPDPVVAAEATAMLAKRPLLWASAR